MVVSFYFNHNISSSFFVVVTVVVSTVCVGTFVDVSDLSTSLMDQSELIYVITADEDLPLSLQLTHAHGKLQPHILPKPSTLPCPSNHHHAITVCDEQGNDMSEDVTIEEFEYILDENGEVFRSISNKSNVLSSLNCSQSLNTTECSKSSMTQDVSEATVVADIKNCDAQTIAVSEDGSRTNRCDMQHDCEECDETESVTASVQDDSERLNYVTPAVRENRVPSDCTFPISAELVAAETDQNIDAASIFCESSPSPVCVNSQSLSNDMQTGTCSVPSSPESLCHGTPESVRKVESDDNEDCMDTSIISTCLENSEKCSTGVADITNIDMTVVSCADNTSLSNSAICDAVDNSTVQYLQSCLSFSVDCHPTFCSCEDSGLCQCSSDQSESDSVPTSCVFPADNVCIITSTEGVLSCVDDSSKVDSVPCLPPSPSNTPSVDHAVYCNSDSSECQVADHMHTTATGFGDSSEHSISSCSLTVESGSCMAEQHSANRIATVDVTDISASDVHISEVATTKLDQLEMNDFSHVETTRDITDIHSAGEVRSSCSISSPPNSSNEDFLTPTSDCDVPTLDESVQQKIDITWPGDEADVSGSDAGSICSWSSALDTVPVMAGKECLASEQGHDTVDSVVQDTGQKLTDSVADTDCLLQEDCTADYEYVSCQDDFLEAASDCSDNYIHEMRQRLCELHRTRNRLRKLRQNKPSPTCVSSFDRLHRNIVDLDTLCELDRKRLRLESIERELTNREVSLHHREEELNVRLLRVEQHEQVIRVREQLLARCCPASKSREDPELTTGSLSQPVPKLQSVDHQSDAVKGNCKTQSRSTTRWHKPHLLRKKKVLRTFDNITNVLWTRKRVCALCTVQQL